MLMQVNKFSTCVQVTTSPTVLAGGVTAGKSLLTTPVSQNQQMAASAATKTVTVTQQLASQVTTSSATPVLKTVTLTHQQMQAMNAARGLTGATLRDSSAVKTSSTNSPAALRMVSMIMLDSGQGFLVTCCTKPCY